MFSKSKIDRDVLSVPRAESLQVNKSRAVWLTTPYALPSPMGKPYGCPGVADSGFISLGCKPQTISFKCSHSFRSCYFPSPT